MRTIAKVLTTTIILILAIHLAYGRKIYAFFQTLDCSYYDADYIEQMKCWLEPDRSGQLMMNAVLKFKYELNNVISRFRIIVEQPNKNITYLSMDIDICNALGAAHRNPLLRLVSEEIRRISNFPLACPLKKGIDYVIRNFTINSKYIPSFAPRLRWITHSDFYTNISKSIVLQYINSGRIDYLNPMKVPAG